MNKRFFLATDHFPSKTTGWRCRAKLMIDGSAIGLYKPGTHEIDPLPHSADHHPLINEIVESLLKGDSTSFKAVQITVDPKSSKAQVAFSAVKPTVPVIQHPSVISLWLNVNTAKTNTIFSNDWRHISGLTHLPVTVLGKQFFFHPGAFIQANLEQFEKAILDILENLPPGKTLTEYYAGIGVIGTLLAPRLNHVTCVEINPFAEEAFYKGDPPTHMSFITSPTEKSILPADISLLDPPRKGVDVKPLYMIDSPHIIYMSCNPITFERDCKCLFERGYKLTRCVTFDFFPGTDHIEVLGYFSRH